MIAELDGTNAMVAAYTNGPTGLVSQRRNNATKFHLFDALGSTRQLTDSTQTVTDSYTYEAYGNLLSQGGTSVNPAKYVGSQGYYADNDSGLQLLGHRYYDPTTGRFITLDPIKDGVNWYVYCENNPVNGVDPEGLSAIGKLIELCGMAMKTIKSGMKYEECVEAAKEGEDLLCSSRRAAYNVGKGACPGKPPIHHGPHKPGYRPHYHPADFPGGHIFYSLDAAASCLTLSHYAQGHGTLAKVAACIGDFFNPLTLPKDCLDGMQMVAPLLDPGSLPKGGGNPMMPLGCNERMMKYAL